MQLHDSSIRLTISPEGGERANEAQEHLILIPNDYETCGAPVVGARLSEEEVERLRHGGRRYEALSRALRILAAGDNSASLLFTKLRRHGIDRADAAFAVKYALSHGYLHEESQIERLILKKAEEKLWGRARILEDLRAKGYRSEDIHAVLDRLESSGALDFEDICTRLFEKKHPKNNLERAKIAMQHGFDLPDAYD